MDVLGVRIDRVTHTELQHKIAEFLATTGHIVFTPNPEMLVDAQKDIYFKEVLNASDLNIADGKGIQLMTLGKVTRIAGTDTVMDICEYANKKGHSIFLLGTGEDAVLDKAKQNLVKLYPNCKIVGTHPGLRITQIEKNGRLVLQYNEQENNDMIADIALASPDILFVAFGHAKQEKWIDEHIDQLPSVRLAMGIGGALDYISGSIKRAPKWMRALGLEWLFRLFVQPQRIGRILKATVVFPLYMVFKK